MKDLQGFFATQWSLMGQQCAHYTVETSIKTPDGILRITSDPEIRITTMAWEPNLYIGVTDTDYVRLKVATRLYAQRLADGMPWHVEDKGTYVRAMVGWGVVNV